jgi:predicted acyl esterase
MMYSDSMMYPWFAQNEYLCFRVDLQGSGDSGGTIADEYTEEEMLFCKQVIEQIAMLPICSGSVGMMGKSWSAINSLMMAARDDCPKALKAIVVCCGSDDRFNDDVHYMGGAMMYDNFGWPSAMWGWLPLPPDPAVVGDEWKEIWTERINAMDYWFSKWGAHQTRDGYWSKGSVRDEYNRVKIPVHILSGWLDGYKNPVERAVRALGERGHPVSGLIGPWGHKYPFDGYPGPRIDWLRYVVTHWWDKWLKGIEPDPRTAWPQFVAWLGESREPSPNRTPNYTEVGKWISEDHDWMSRKRDVHWSFASDHALTSSTPSDHGIVAVKADVSVGTSMLETSSWGEEFNDDLPGDQQHDDARSMSFTSEPLSEDLTCFGYPVVRLNLECNQPVASIAVRLCELSPTTGGSHLVNFTFFNLCDQDGTMSHPVRVKPGVFRVDIPLNVFGHIFKKGWRLRVSISPSFFPTLWQTPEATTIKVHTGPVGNHPASGITLPTRADRVEDARVQALLPEKTAYVKPEIYVPTVKTIRKASSLRKATKVTLGGKPGMMVQKSFDSGANVLGGALRGLLVDQTGSETYTIINNDPMSLVGKTRYASLFKRGEWEVRSVTETRLWTEKKPSGEIVFKYSATAKTFIGKKAFRSRRVSGEIPRRWV